MLHPEDFATVLGIFSPWKIEGVEISPLKEELLIKIAKESNKKEFFFFGSNKKDENQRTIKWHHVKLGHFNTVIQLTISVNDFMELDLSGIGFVGRSDKSITNELADTIHLAASKGLSADLISSLIGTPRALIEQELDPQNQNEQRKSTLPLASNNIWSDILTDKIRITTKLLPLKLLLSRLKLEVEKADLQKPALQRCTTELRDFFLKNEPRLQSEYIQVGAQTSATNKKKSSKRPKFLIPGLNNPVWSDIFYGRISLLTDHTGFKFSLAQHSQMFKNAATTEDRMEVIKKFQMFIKSNAKFLIPVLKQLTELVDNAQPKPVNELPPPNHEVWKRLLTSDSVLKSQKVNYQLLLSKLKLSYQLKHDSESPVQLYQFFKQNADAMTEEIINIQKLASAQ